MPTPDGLPTPEEQARIDAGQYHAIARQAIDQVESLLGQLTQTISSLTDPQTLAGEGNLDWYRHEAAARIVELRGTLAGLETWQERLTGFLVQRGVDADIWPPRRPEGPRSRPQEPDPADAPLPSRS
jgi:hypothetical protein